NPSASVTNAGTWTLAANLALTFSDNALSFSSTGTLDLGAASTFAQSAGQFRWQAGPLNGGGTLFISGATATLSADFTQTQQATLIASNSTVTGPGNITVPKGQTLQLGNSTLTNTLTVHGTLHIRGNSTVSGPLENAADGVVLIRGDNAFGTGSLTVSQPWTNHGLLELTSIESGQAAQLLGANMANAADGTVLISQGTGGSRAINA